ncbi:hypothetical protein CW745_01275 [Psychromonas sp. psych-6C06]|uniref:hypothetical protein n=1 Tax=Psychromonas sp. psych-6C06 TaxID=2058089 RepID=UPI000C349047|nr:hypothetical protein [Psychromonas sp. psych-6C06]PKF63511.1 hypothetical protein CW745_01275 [Psychromonas sp. psych-6C06]
MVDGAFEWNGLAIITASYKSAGVGAKDNNDQGPSKGAGRPGAKPKPRAIQNTFSQKDLKNQWVLIAPGKTPENPQAVPLNEYFTS